MTLRDRALTLLCLSDPQAKCAAVHQLRAEAHTGCDRRGVVVAQALPDFVADVRGDRCQQQNHGLQAFLHQAAIEGGVGGGFFQHVHQGHHLGDGGVEFVVLANIEARLLDRQMNRAAHGLLLVIQAGQVECAGNARHRAAGLAVAHDRCLALDGHDEVLGDLSRIRVLGPIDNGCAIGKPIRWVGNHGLEGCLLGVQRVIDRNHREDAGSDRYRGAQGAAGAEGGPSARLHG